MTDSRTPAEPQQRRLPRARTITIATVAAAGVLTGGVVAANAATSGTAKPSSGSGSRPAAPPTPSANDLDGTLTAASSDSITVKSEFGTSRTFAVSSKTTVHRGKSKVAASALETGQRVHVRATKSGSTYTATDVDVHQAHIDGSVTSISGSDVTVTDHDGFTRSITVASGATYTKDGSKASSSDLKSGSVIHAEGAVDSDGTTLDANSVDIRTKAATPPGPGAGGPAGGPPAPPAGAPGKSGSKNGGKASAAPAAPAKPPAAPSGSASKSGS